ncbi:MAG: hypothetical protein H6977_13295 [Gammaproteobacteria bacterium]|nr:hypothetical protein [Gammaproteobacteria bacterium]
MGVALGRLPARRAQKVLVLLEPDVETCKSLGASVADCDWSTDGLFSACCEARAGSLRSFFDYLHFDGPNGRVVVVDDAGRCVWRLCEADQRKILLVGTRLAEDLALLRQGDRTKTTRPRSEWGFDFERPTYLFDGLAAPAPSRERLADQWCETLARTLSELAGVSRLPLLPGNARAAVVITGDDDQAAISAYETQLAALDGLPVTYFMHPATKIDSELRGALFARRTVDFELHPDALHAPEQYGTLLEQQSRWFARHFGLAATAVRNHGFLNDGYWRHAPHWVRAGLTASSNLPGLNGTILNGSLLPARLVLDDCLLDHWSLLTAFGDGMLFALEMSDADAARHVLEFADAIVESSIPGILVINLHPENASRAPQLHRAMHELGERGFLYWTLSECIAWFNSRDKPLSGAAVRSGKRGFKAAWRRLFGGLGAMAVS